MRFLKRGFLIWICCSFAIHLAIVIGRQHQLSEKLTDLHLNECKLPCWIGIIPGKTTIAEASKYILDTYGSNSSNYAVEFTHDPVWRFMITNKTDGLRIRVSLNELAGQPANAMVNEIYIIFDKNSGYDIVYGDLYSVVGYPTDVILSAPDDAPYPVIRYNDQQVHVSLDVITQKNMCAQLSPERRVDFITIYNHLPQFGDYAWVSKSVPWKGFMSCYYFVDIG